MTASLLYKIEGFLSEGPYWHAKRNSIFWVDIEKQLLHEYNESVSGFNTWKLPHCVSMIAGDRHNQLVLALQGGLARFNPDDGSLNWLFCSIRIKVLMPQKAGRRNQSFLVAVLFGSKKNLRIF